MRINEYRETIAARINESTEKEALRIKWRKELGKIIMGKQTLREILLVFKLPVRQPFRDGRYFEIFKHPNYSNCGNERSRL